MRNFIGFIVLISLLVALMLLLFKHFPDAISSDQHKIALISSLVIITSMIAKIASSNIKLKVLLHHIGGWLLITLLIISGYSYQLEIKQFSNRLTANLVPGYGQGNGDGSVTFYLGNNGHFTVTALLNDAERIDFLLDTGASSVSLTPQAAASIGIDLDSLQYNYPLSTANGLSWGAKITIDKMEVGPIIVYNIEGTVSKDGALDTPLLGMSFLNRLREFQIQGNKLTLMN